MGKGDIRTKRGKIFRGTYGNRRPKKRRKKAAADATKTGKGEQT
jgi:30S ribosomal protein S31